MMILIEIVISVVCIMWVLDFFIKVEISLNYFDLIKIYFLSDKKKKL